MIDRSKSIVDPGSIVSIEDFANAVAKRAAFLRGRH
jgi:hypothetical protein